MNIKKILTASILAATFVFNTANAAADRETVNQVALLQSLTVGYFDGSISVKDLKKLGDTGIGTFEGLNGELVFLDGVVYQGDQSCHANVMSDKETVPFANVTFFDKDFSENVSNLETKTALEEHLNQIVKRLGENSFFMVKIPAHYAEILIRSEQGQQKPYPTLVQALQKTQNEVTLNDADGTIVGLYCPAFMSSLNSVGWHFHFISKDKKFAGHVLGLNLQSGELQLDQTDKFAMVLPSKDNFHNLNLGQDLSEDIRKAEQDRRE